jgi:hypothetical protein
MVRHERWCITCHPAVQYAYEVVVDPEKLTLIDRLTLHALDWLGARIAVRGDLPGFLVTRRMGGCRRWNRQRH